MKLCRLNFVSHSLFLIHSSTKCGHSTLIKNTLTMVSCRGHEQKDRMVGWMGKWMKALPHRLPQSHDCSGSKHLRTAAGGGERQRSEESFNYVHHTHTTNTCKRAETPQVHFPCPLFNTRWQYYTSPLCRATFSISGHLASSCGQRYFCSSTKHSITIIIILGFVWLFVLPGYSGSHSRPGLCVRSDDVPGRVSHT